MTRLAVRLAAAFALFVPLAGLVSIEALFAPDAELWRRWQAHDPASRISLDHSAWDGILDAYVLPGADGVNRIDYRGVRAEDRAALDAYLAALAGTRVSALNRDEQRAFWINLYNALTVKVVLDHYPVQSIRDIDISPGLFADGPWDAKLLRIEGEAVSLNDIEHRILRPIWRDPRLHYAVNCASIGCPNLLREAFDAGNAERLLEAGARAYVNHPRGARLADEKLVVSSIYVWFQEDFGGTEAGVIEHLRRYADPPLTAALEGVAGLAGHGYDWRLNDAAAGAGG